MSEARERPKRVLIIDDDEQHLELTARLLRNAGYEVLTRGESMGACAAVTATGPDMVLMDMNMPNLDGDRLTPLIQRCTGVRPIVVLYSGMHVPTFKERAEACQADAAIPKGMPPKEFLERVAHVFAEASRASAAPLS